MFEASKPYIFWSQLKLLKCSSSKFLWIFAIGLLLTGSLNAQNFTPGKRVSLGITAGTTGVGISVATTLNRRMNLQLGYHYFNIESSGTIENEETSIDYSGKFSQGNFSMITNYYPFKKGLKLSAGFYYQDFSLTGQGQFNEAFTLNEGANNEKTLSPQRLGSIAIEITYPQKLMPYVGIGFGNPVAEGWPVKFNISLGLLYSGEPEIQMIGEGLIAPTVDHAMNFQNAFAEFQWFPVFQLGISVRIINVPNKLSVETL